LIFFVKGYSARSIIAFFIGMAAGVVTTFVLAFTQSKTERREGNYKPAVAAAVLVAVLWACFGFAALALNYSSIEEHIQTLRSGKTWKMERAAFALSREGSAAVEPLIACLRAPRPATRFYAAKALGRIGDDRAVPPLMKLLKRSIDNQPSRPDSAQDQEVLLARQIHHAATVAVGRITGKDFEGDPQRCLSWWREKGRRKWNE
jgi:hypothetical protein